MSKISETLQNDKQAFLEYIKSKGWDILDEKEADKAVKENQIKFITDDAVYFLTQSEDSDVKTLFVFEHEDGKTKVIKGDIFIEQTPDFGRYIGTVTYAVYLFDGDKKWTNKYRFNDKVDMKEFKFILS